ASAASARSVIATRVAAFSTLSRASVAAVEARFCLSRDSASTRVCAAITADSRPTSLRTRVAPRSSPTMGKRICSAMHGRPDDRVPRFQGGLDLLAPLRRGIRGGAGDPPWPHGGKPLVLPPPFAAGGGAVGEHGVPQVPRFDRVQFPLLRDR